MTAGDGRVPFAIPDITEAEIEAVAQAMRSGWLTTGPNAAAFEREFVEYLGGGDLIGVAVNSATAGLHLAIEALGIGPGDEVLVPTWTFTATAEIVRYVGATPVIVDVRTETLNIDLEHAEHLLTPRTKAMIPVHFAGVPVGASAVREFAARHNLAVVEDAAHAFPVRDGDRFVGNGDSDAVVFSFYATKTIATGEGGMLVTRDPDLARRARTMRLHGISRDVFDRYSSRKPSWEYEVVAPGFKYNLTDVAAAMGRVQLRRAEEMRRNRMAIAERYRAELADLPLRLPAPTPDPAGHAHHLFVVQVEDDAPIGRNRLIEELSTRGVSTSVHFIPLHLHPYWRETFDLKPESFPVATDAYARTVSLPIFSSMTTAQVDQVVEALQEVLGPHAV
ncbi:DegT/DnrJ/EryC1/StrS family aminotransferase [Microbacterium sp.]|jgi:dTDP-4-amino-4,6-dideoxygalactose transaminase|uniref:DegT/DnrJ/EryC1/StrS family aminotransferase n=1 Tax=Microbacterium sp. TaxID=51671 RepID=UPI002CDF84FD|nr:DegT/DnrJ/EryC1/StrS family aminotransferase [Microbacterium sp.]HWL78719.1 DegT/DnrJ/EryC1/StrS family aminotransferase [Microbacterium sp.]HWV35828.1 DegT/DnrJ/EryC1/StrS family aminotransferase [Thermomicrobiales bacterium]